MDIYETIEKFYTTAQTEKRILGKSCLGRKIFAVKVGEGSPVGIAQYAIHGREWITALIAIAHYKIGVAKGSLWLVPLANPDGALLSQRGLSSIKKKTALDTLLRLNAKSEDFSLWKANARGVDLNVNFDADWGKGKKNLRTPGAENYIGTSPFSEPETRALKAFTEYVKPDYTVSYHTKGEEIYWYFQQSLFECARDYALAAALSKATGYPLAYASGSVGGYKDWCIRRFQIPSFTIEAGEDCLPHPLGLEALEGLIKKNERALYALSKEYKTK